MEAAIQILAGALAEGDLAVEHFLNAAKIYETIPNRTERSLSIALAHRAAGSSREVMDSPLYEELCRFASTNQATRLLDLG